MTELRIDMQRHMALAYTAANAVAGRKNIQGHVDRDDIVGHLLEWTTNNARRLNEWDEHKPNDEYVRLVTAVLYDEAHIYARRQKALRFGHPTSDDFFYTKGMIEDILPTVLDESRETWLNVPAKAFDEFDGGRPTKALSEGNNWLATLADVARAYARLNIDDKKLLRDTYLYGISSSTLAEAASEEITRQGVDKRIERALRRLWRELGGPEWIAPDERPRRREREDGPGTRRAMSNAAARALTDSQWENAS